MYHPIGNSKCYNTRTQTNIDGAIRHYEVSIATLCLYDVPDAHVKSIIVMYR